MTTIYKICEAAHWAQAQVDGEYRGSAVDFADGYIHFSTAAQVAATAAKHFAGMSGLVVVAVDAEFGLALCRGEDGAQSSVEIALVDTVEPGDRLLVHAGTAIALLDHEGAIAQR